MKWLVLVLILGITLVGASIDSKVGLDLNKAPAINYSLIPTVNNSLYFNGYSTSSLYSYYLGLFNSVYYSINNPFSFYNSTTIPFFLNNINDSMGDSFTYLSGQTAILNITTFDNRYLAGGYKSFYFTNHTSDVAGMYNTTLNVTELHPEDVTISTVVGDGETIVADFLSPVEPPYTVAEGTRFFHLTASVSSIAQSTQLRGYIYRTNLTGGNLTLLRNSSLSMPLTLVPAEYIMTTSGSIVVINSTERILFRIVSERGTTGVNPTVNLHVEDATYSRLDVPSPVGVTVIPPETDPFWTGNQSSYVNTTLLNNSLAWNLWGDCEVGTLDPINQHMIAYYKLDGNPLDSYKYKYHGNFSSPIFPTNLLKVGGAGDFYTGGYVTIPDNNDLDLLNGFTIQLWFKKGTSLYNNNTALINKGSYSLNWTFPNDYSGSYLVFTMGSSSISSSKLELDGASGTGYHIVISQLPTSNLTKMYINGVLNASAVMNKPVNTSNNLVIGRNLDAIFDEVAFYNYDIGQYSTRAYFGPLLSYVKSYNGKNYCEDIELFDRLPISPYALYTAETINTSTHYQRDNVKHIFGTDLDSSVYYNGTDMIINPKEVGTGRLFLLGQLNTSDNVTAKFFRGDGRYLINTNYTETDPKWTGNQSSYRTLTNLTFIGNTQVVGNFNQNSGNSTINNYYGEMYNRTSGTITTGFETIDLVTPDVYVQAKNLTAGNLNGFSVSQGNLTLIDSNGYGLYRVDVAISANEGSVSTYGVKLYLNETGQNNCYNHFHTSANQGGNPTITCMVRLNSTQNNINIRFDDHTNPVNDLALSSMNINAMRIGN